MLGNQFNFLQYCMLRNNFPHLCCWKAAKKLNICCRKWNQTLPTFWNRYKKNVSILIISFIIIISIIFMIIIISSIAQINSWPLAQNMCGTRICVGLAYTGTCATLYLPVWEIYLALFRTTITQLKKQNKKHKYWTKSFLGNEFCLLFVFCCFVLHIIWCMLLLMCFDLHASSSSFLTPLFHWERRQKV